MCNTILQYNCNTRIFLVSQLYCTCADRFSAKKFYNYFKTIVHNTDVHSLSVGLPNLFGVGTYNKGERLSVKFSFNKHLGV